jgi:predicted permease
MSWIVRFANLFRQNRLDDDIDDELRFHLEQRGRELEDKGMSPSAAAVEARRMLGNRLILRETSREIKILAWLDCIAKDVRFGVRMLRKDSVVTLATLVSLAMAIGACTAAFSLVDALILRPLAVKDPEQLIYLSYPTFSADRPHSDFFNYPLFERLRDAGREHIDLFGVNHGNERRIVFSDSGDEERVRTQYVSGNMFEMLAIKPSLGRVLTASDDVKPGGHPIAVLNHGFWMRRFAGDRSAIGRSFTMGEQSFQIVGVAEKGFNGVEPGKMVDVWVPNMMWNREALSSRGWSWFRILGRLKPGITSEVARSILQPVFTQFRRERAQNFRADEPREFVESFVNAPLQMISASNGPSTLRRDFERPLWILATVVGLVLLIAGSNVANLFLARATAREREMSLRLSIGASRGRLIQQLLIESGLLALIACALGLFFASAAAPLVVRLLAPSSTPAYLDLRVDLRVLSFLSALGLITTILFGLVPALRASRVAPLGALKTAGGRLSSSASLLRPLIAVQVGFSLAILFVAGLLVASFAKLSSVNLGFDEANLVVVDLVLRDVSTERARARIAQNELLDRVRSTPGVVGAAFSQWALFSGSSGSNKVRIPGKEPESFEPHYLPVSPGFFETMRIRTIAGRTFNENDSKPERPTAVIINEAFARRYFANEPALGRVYERLERENLVRQEIVGIVADARYGGTLRQPAPPTAYRPLRDIGSLIVRTTGNPLLMVPTLQREIDKANSSLRIWDVSLQSTLVDNTMLQERLLALLSAFFAIVGVLLAMVGLYGVLSYSVLQRTKEIGIRVALGAQSSEIVWSVLARTSVMVVIGTLCGLAGGAYLARFLSTILFEVKPLSLGSLVLPIACMTLGAIMAAIPPSLRAANIDPVIALRYE